MNLLQKLRSSTTPPTPISERDRLTAEISYEQGNLPELELLVRMGRRSQDDLDAQRKRIADLQVKLHGLEIEEAEVQRVRDACSTELPGAELELSGLTQDLVNDLLRLQTKVRTIQDKRTAMIDRFADFKAMRRGQVKVPVRNCELLPLTNGRLLDECRDPYGPVANFLKRARAAGFVVPEPDKAKPVPSRTQAVQSTRGERQHRPVTTAVSAQERRVRKATGNLKQTA